MNEQNRLRLQRITSKHTAITARARDDAHEDAAFLATFARTRADVLEPVMNDIGAQLASAGYAFQVTNGGDERSPSIELHIVIPDRGESKDTIRFFARKYVDKGWQVIADLELLRSPVELTRFNVGEPIPRDVVEHLIVDAVEQMFASTIGRR